MAKTTFGINQLPAAPPALAPVQIHRPRGKAVVPWAVHMKAYEVYRELYGEQQALVEGGCRGGFGGGELVAFLYAHAFPKEEWSARVHEAFHGMDLG